MFARSLGAKIISRKPKTKKAVVGVPEGKPVAGQGTKRKAGEQVTLPKTRTVKEKRDGGMMKGTTSPNSNPLSKRPSKKKRMTKMGGKPASRK